MNEWLELFLGQVPEVPRAGQILTDDQALRWALCEGFKGYGLTSPNPPVGCVWLDAENRFLFSGYHHKAGDPHAEIEALAQLLPPSRDPHYRQMLDRTLGGWDLSNLPLEKLRGARVFVTLEPCAHEARTPSCAKTLAQLPISEVVVVLRDPNQKVSGKGFEILKKAGKKVRCLELESPHGDLLDAGRALCETFLINQEFQRPFISLKVASSLDGVMALKNGESQWLTTEKSRNFARFLRGSHDVCLVGKGTILQDNPRLDARETVFSEENRKIAILDLNGEILDRPELQIFKTHLPENIFLCVGPDSRQHSSSQAQVIQMSGANPKEFLTEAVQKLWEREVLSIWIEGGAATLSSALEAGLGDRLWLFQGAHLLGARFGRSWTESWGGSQMQNRLTLAQVHHLSLGPDHLTTGQMTTVNS